MKKLLAFVALILLVLPSLDAGAAADQGSLQEAEAMVKRAIVYYDKHGKAKSISEFSRSPGTFVDRDLYVTVYTLQGVPLAHINPRLIGKDLMDLRDPDGKYIVRDRMELAQKQGKGWQDIKFFNPVSKKIEPKRVYFEKHDNLVFACGAYQPE